MTKVKLSYEGKTMNLEVEGHAERSKDEDVNLCCAGISMLVNAAIETIQRYAELDLVEEMHVLNVSGHAKLTAKAYDRTRYRIAGIFEMIMAGFDLLEERYPGKIEHEYGINNAGRN